MHLIKSFSGKERAFQEAINLLSGFCNKYIEITTNPEDPEFRECVGTMVIINGRTSNKSNKYNNLFNKFNKDYYILKQNERIGVIVKR